MSSKVFKSHSLADQPLRKWTYPPESTTSRAHVYEKYPQLFHGLRELGGEYEIQLTPNAQPFAITSPRRISPTMKSKVKAEIERMEKLGVIRKVEQPTKWCAGMVTVPKPNRKVRICVDLTKLNENMSRLTHFQKSTPSWVRLEIKLCLAS